VQIFEQQHDATAAGHLLQRLDQLPQQLSRGWGGECFATADLGTRASQPGHSAASSR
jgi:hypothetical protein